LIIQDFSASVSSQVVALSY